jgi:hypothetical protein
MKVSRLVRFLAVPALAVPVLAVSLSSATPAVAAATVCTGLSGSATGTPPPTLAGCNDTANTGGGGTFTGLSSPTTVSWASGGTSTFTFSFKVITKKVKCAAGDTEASLKGKITGSTGVGSSVKGKVKGEVCVDSNENLSLVPGTTFKL